MSVIVFAPHPDDEVLGVGATIARLATEGRRITVVIVTRGRVEDFGVDQVVRVNDEARAAHEVLGVSETLFLDFPAARLDQVPHAELNASFTELVAHRLPTTVYLPFRGDLHLDHRLVFDSAMVAMRPAGEVKVNEILAYETLSETNWNAARGISAPFVPDCFVDVENYLGVKLEAMKLYASQLRQFPKERSVEAIEALARHRGATVGILAAEAFMTVRRVL